MSADGEAGPAHVDAESTFRLLDRVRGGDDAALEALFARYLKPLQQWASGRLPYWARQSADTHDVVQDTLLKTFKKIEGFVPRREGAFQAYLRQAVMNRIRDHIRQSKSQPERAPFDEEQHEHPGSPFDDLVGVETLERYDAALARLTASEQEAVIGRVEFGRSYEELAGDLEKPSADAARMAVSRALVRLAEEMARELKR
jgi:RNA polymerase sigma factor (sigma-70 family)